MASSPIALIESTDELQRAAARLSGRGLVGLDLETEGLDPHQHRTLLLTLGDDREQILVDCRKGSLEPLRSLLEGPVLKVTHNGAFDAAMLRALGLRVEHLVDTMLIEQVLRNGRPAGALSLSSLAERYLGQPLDKSERLGFASTTGAFSQGQLEYARRDVLATYLILQEQLPLLGREGLEATARLECEALPAFADLHLDGIFLDGGSWSRLIEEARREKEEIASRLDGHFRKVVQVDLFGRVDLPYENDQALREALQKLLGQPVLAINKRALARFEHPAIPDLLRLRELGKVLSTYGKSFLEAIHPCTGRIHASFRQIGAPTGRVACHHPNLQAIPRGSRFRECFRAPPGKQIIAADYSGCELRILAEMSGDPAFVRTFQTGGDLHAIVASQIFGVPVSKQKNAELRDRAKAINFGLAYGMGAAGLSAATGLGEEEAEQLLNRYFRAFPRIKDYLERSAREALERGFSSTLGGRKLFFQKTAGLPPQELSALARVAKNMPIQGTNADMLKLAMARIRRRFLDKGLDARMVLCVHDEIVVEAADADADEAMSMVKREMIQAGARFVQKVPMEVEVSLSDHWQK